MSLRLLCEIPLYFVNNVTMVAINAQEKCVSDNWLCDLCYGR